MTAGATGPAEPQWTVPGFAVMELLGFGASGEVWLGRENATGELVALKRLRTPRDLAARDRLRREAAALACVDHPHVVRLRTLVSVGDELVLVLDHAAGGSLASLIAARRLGAAEVVTVGVPLAEALAAVHARGLVHGDVTPANVLFAGDGRPLLSDLGVSRLVGEQDRCADVISGTPGFFDPAVLAGAAPGPAADVHGLAAVCFAALTGAAPYDADGRRRALLTESAWAVPASLAAVVEAGLATDPHQRPTPVEFGAAVFDSCPAEPVVLAVAGPLGLVEAEHEAAAPVTHQVRIRPVEPVEADAAPSVRRRRRTRERSWVPRAALRRARVVLRSPTAVVMALVMGVASIAVFGGMLWAGNDGGESAAAVRPARDPVAGLDWSAVLGRLDLARSQAFAEADPARLADVYAPEAPALARDRELIEQLRASGHTAHGVSLEPTSVQVADVSAHRVDLRVVDVMPPYQLVTADGVISDSRPGRPSAQWSVTLVREGSAWRMYDVRRG